MHKLRLILLLSLLPVILSVPIGAQDTPQKQEELGAWIMSRVVINAEKNEKIKREYITYDKTVYKYDMEKNPPQLKSFERFNIYGVDGQSLEKLTEINGKEARNSSPQISNLNFNVIIGERYDFTLIGEELINGRAYFLISFKPKEPLNELPFNNRMDEGINRMRGTLYVDIEELYVWKLEGQLTEKFGKVAGLFEMKSFTITLVQENRFGVIVPLTMDINYRYRIFFGHTHERLLYTYSNHFDKREFVGPVLPPK